MDYKTMFMPVNEFGKAVERTKQDYPYSYDGFITYRNGKNEEANHTIYSDRLLQWDRDKYNKLSKKHFGDEGQYFYSRNPKSIEAFLAEWTEQEVKLIFIMEYCHMSSGYPVWRFDFAATEKLTP